MKKRNEAKNGTSADQHFGPFSIQKGFKPAFFEQQSKFNVEQHNEFCFCGEIQIANKLTKYKIKFGVLYLKI